MKGLFVGRHYVDVTAVTEAMPEGDEKADADDHAFSLIGGNAVTAAFCCAKLGIPPDLLSTVGQDDLGLAFVGKAVKYGIQLHHRDIHETPLSLLRPKDGKRSILRLRRKFEKEKDEYIHSSFPELEPEGYRGLHLDGHQSDAAMHYAKLFRQHGILTSLDAGSKRGNTHELLQFIDVAVASEGLCQNMGLKTAEEMLSYLRGRGCKVGVVTLGGDGLVMYEGAGENRHLPAFRVPQHLIVDTTGAGDICNGARMYSYLRSPEKSWEEHFRFGMAAAASGIQHLGNEASLPSLENVESILAARPIAVGQ